MQNRDNKITYMIKNHLEKEQGDLLIKLVHWWNKTSKNKVITSMDYEMENLVIGYNEDIESRDNIVKLVDELLSILNIEFERI